MGNLGDGVVGDAVGLVYKGPANEAVERRLSNGEDSYIDGGKFGLVGVLA